MNSLAWLQSSRRADRAAGGLLSEPYRARRERLGDRLLNAVQDHHSCNGDHQGSNAAKYESLHPQPPSIGPSSHVYDTACREQARRSLAGIGTHRAVALHGSERKDGLKVSCRPSERIGGPCVKFPKAILCFAALCSIESAFSIESASAQPAQTNSSATQTPPEEKGQAQPQGWTGPINTGAGGAPAGSPQGQSPPGMQAAPQGSSKTTTAPAK